MGRGGEDELREMLARHGRAMATRTEFGELVHGGMDVLRCCLLEASRTCVRLAETRGRRTRT